jgi:peptidoglycan/LPS O-acetylase OafA/YrhL
MLRKLVRSGKQSCCVPSMQERCSMGHALPRPAQNGQLLGVTQLYSMREGGAHDTKRISAWAYIKTGWVARGRMKSSSGSHFIALDHVRALAAFMVFTWHFTHGRAGYPVSLEYFPAFFPFALLDEGHTGVALFMTLSGYLFAKLLDGKSIDFKAFLWNRALRLLPLLFLVILIVGAIDLASGRSDIRSFVYNVSRGLIFPTLPNGGWSITVEFHYYLILPAFLWMFTISKSLPVTIIIAAIAVRLAIHHQTGEVQTWAYWTILGRVDQFAIGMLLYHFRAHFAYRHVLVVSLLSAFALFYWTFDMQGGFYKNPSYPSPDLIWVILPTIEGLAYAVGIAWYDNSFRHTNSGASRFVGRIGEYSYSIYLFHFFFVFSAAKFIHENIMDLSNFYVACAWSAVMFVAMMPICYLSFRFIESPFLNLRKRYILAPTPAPLGAVA